ncbi:hypothetical protein M8818_003200 [Zalaria obscura]|uniref:Uncharacterized protein n=1 Tax=Zalaria obscura TaxID=2024903 RepID=A0ACC3SFX3_9PEZI
MPGTTLAEADVEKNDDEIKPDSQTEDEEEEGEGHFEDRLDAETGEYVSEDKETAPNDKEVEKAVQSDNDKSRARYLKGHHNLIKRVFADSKILLANPTDEDLRRRGGEDKVELMSSHTE